MAFLVLIILWVIFFMYYPLLAMGMAAFGVISVFALASVQKLR